MVSKSGGNVLEQQLGFADGYVFFPIMFLLPKDSLRINPEDTT